MKNEDRIVELLAESLQRLDRQEDLLKQLVESQKQLSFNQIKLVDSHEKLVSEFHKMNDHLAYQTGKNGRPDRQAGR